MQWEATGAPHRTHGCVSSGTVVEGAVTAVIVGFVRKARPDIFANGVNNGSGFMKNLVPAFLALALVTGGFLKVFEVPFWVILICGGMIALGTSVGGWSLIRTLGGKFYKIRPVDGFASQLTSAATILGASLVGGPVSTTQVVSSAIMGVGAAERVNKVRWGVAQEIATAWLLTIPATALVAAGLYWVISQFIH